MGLASSIPRWIRPEDKQSSDDAHLHIIIVGAGLSGLATAISCASHGHSVQVIEQAKELAEVRPSCPVHDAPS